MQRLRAIQGDKQLCRRFPAEFAPSIRVNVRHHQVNVILSEIVEGGAAWKNPADEFMIQLDIGLLSRRVWVTIEEMNVVALNFLWIGEFSAVIGQKNGEHERKALAKPFSEPIETGNDRSGGIGIP